MIEIVNPLALYAGLPLIAALAYYLWFIKKEPVYSFSSLIAVEKTAIGKWQRIVLYLLKIGSLLALCFALARFRMPDTRSKLPVEGIDIMLVIDISESMLLFDDPDTKKSRIDSARDEAIKFIDKRENDPIGLVIFAGAALSRCPLTLDKTVLKQILRETDVTTIRVGGTAIARAILTAANRLKKSQAKTKIMILLTDGNPQNDINPQIALDLAKKLGVKIYTIGIGSEDGGFMHHPYFGLQRVPSSFNPMLLQTIAQETGGKFFHAHNEKEMESIYSTIDALEKAHIEAPVYARYFEYYMPLLWLALLLLLAEIFLVTFWWVRL